MLYEDKRTPKEFRHIVLEDLYRIRGRAVDYFDFIFDIGANIGIFSLFAKVLYPNAKIIAVEPSKEALEYLRKNVNVLDIEIDERAIGDGGMLYQKDRTMMFNNRFVPKENIVCETYGVESITFSNLFKESGCSLSDSYLIKVDIEGGERYLLEDKKVEDILRHAKQFSMELHFKGSRVMYKHWLEWPVYNDWLQKIFADTHNIQYYCSNKHQGYGHYCIKIKEVK